MDVIKRTLDAMSAVKMNVLHFYISDDQGYRIESKVYPRLHELASDGMYNKGSNPLYSNNSSIPIHVIGLGDTTILQDIRIANVKNNDIVFLGNSFISDIYIESDKFNTEPRLTEEPMIIKIQNINKNA